MFGLNSQIQIRLLLQPKMKIVVFTNSVDQDEVAHEPPHLDLHLFGPLIFEFIV